MVSDPRVLPATATAQQAAELLVRPEVRAVLVVEVPGAVAVCFDAPVVELFESRAEALHPALSALGPDLLAQRVVATRDAQHEPRLAPHGLS